MCMLANILLATAVVVAPQPRLFTLPVGAKVLQTSPDGKGWMETGLVDVTFVQAVGRFKSALSRDGWTYQHAVPLAGPVGRTLYSWRRGKQELTVMLWNAGVGRTGFSWGVANETSKGKKQ